MHERREVRFLAAPASVGKRVEGNDECDDTRVRSTGFAGTTAVAAPLGKGVEATVERDDSRVQRPSSLEPPQRVGVVRSRSCHSKTLCLQLLATAPTGPKCHLGYATA